MSRRRLGSLPLLRAGRGDRRAADARAVAGARRAALAHRGVPAAVEPSRAARPDSASGRSRARRRCGSRPRRCGPTISPSARSAPAFYERQERAQRRTRSRKTRGRRSSSARTPGKPTYIDQIFTSLKTVFAGFLLATLVAVPLGILCGLSQDVQRRAQSAHPALQAGVAARVAADRHAWSSARCTSTRAMPHVREVVRELGDHGDAVLAVADADQHRARRASIDQDSSTSARVLQLSTGHAAFRSSCCPRRCR